MSREQRASGGAGRVTDGEVCVQRQATGRSGHRSG